MGRSGFALVEAGALVLVAACVAVFVLLLGGEQRRQGRLGEDIGKLRAIGALTGQYSADYQDRFWTFSWKKWQSLSKYPDLNNALDDKEAAANQAVDILRRKAGRDDIPRITAWFPHSMYSHLPLADFTGVIPDALFVSAADTHRLKWSRDPYGFDYGLYQPSPSIDPAGRRWPYSASFQLPTAFYDQSLPRWRVSQGATHSAVNFNGAASLGGLSVFGVAFPSAKVHMHDSNARHFGTKQPYFGHPQARLPLLFVDGAVSVQSSAASNPGWQPTAPTSAAGTIIWYQPDIWEPATFSGGTAEQMPGCFKWTRGTVTEHGSAGRDFFGSETCSGQPGCP